MLKPFLIRHIELADPDVIVLMGNWASTRFAGPSGDHPVTGQMANCAGPARYADDPPGIFVAHACRQTRRLGRPSGHSSAVARSDMRTNHAQSRQKPRFYPGPHRGFDSFRHARL